MERFEALLELKEFLMAEKDLVTRLRESDGFTTFRASDGLPGIRPDIELMRAAADEIERLRAVINEYARGWDQAGNDQGQRLREARKNLLTDTLGTDQ